MGLGQIISSSFTYPFKDFKRLLILCVMFVLPMILPMGIIMYNVDAVVILGIIALLIFVLIIPGYAISIIKKGTMASSKLPNVRIVKNIKDTFKLLVLRIVYMIVPTIIFLVSLFAFGSFTINSISNFRIDAFLSSFAAMIIICFVVYFIFEFLSIFAKARLAYCDSLLESLKIHKVVNDIRKIGVGRVIGWYIVMGILISFISFVCILLFFIPYVGFAIYFCIALPILLTIYYYSLGLLYSSFADGNLSEDELDLDEFEREIQRLKYAS